MFVVPSVIGVSRSTIFLPLSLTSGSSPLFPLKLRLLVGSAGGGEQVAG